ncbi:hypothetical protein ABTQ33_11505 [Paucilactobacillus suebicus]|uniref:hypothetical protein n=1 Tax=Paucilactobacillus suebicus TaxID=152335 RepID=UPI0026D8A8DE
MRELVTAFAKVNVALLPAVTVSSLTPVLTVTNTESETVLPSAFVAVAVIITGVELALTAVITPVVGSTVATDGLLEDQVTLAVAPWFNVAVACSD